MMLIPQGTQTKLNQIAFKAKVVITAVLFYFGFFFFSEWIKGILRHFLLSFIKTSGFWKH